MSENGWGKGSVNNDIGWGAGAINNDIGWGDSHFKSWSGDTDIDGGTGIPVNTVAPVISGTTTLGSVLTTTNGTWTAKPAATFTYQWKRNGSNITGATNSTYTLVNDDGATNITCEVTATNDFGSASATSNTLAIPAFTDADAQAFITAAAITNPTQQTAINNLVIGLKADGLWNKMKAVYPFIGSSATSNSYNLKNTAQFQITWSGGVTHSSTGVAFNGTNGFGNTNWGTTSGNLYNRHFSQYVRSLGTISSWSGRFDGSNVFGMQLNTATSLIQVGCNNLPSSFSQPILANALTVVQVESNTIGKVYNNGGLVHTTSGSINNSPITGNMFLGALSTTTGAGFYHNSNLGFASYGDFLTATEQTAFNTLVKNFNTALGR